MTKLVGAIVLASEINCEWRRPGSASDAGTITLEEILQLEPEIGQMIEEAARPTQECELCRLGLHRVRGYTHRFGPLVGWHSNRPDPRMRTSAAYDLVFQAIWDASPPAWSCTACCGVEDNVPSSKESLTRTLKRITGQALISLEFEYHQRAARAQSTREMNKWSRYATEVRLELERRPDRRSSTGRRGRLHQSSSTEEAR
jgi:hypothetical protein